MAKKLMTFKTKGMNQDLSVSAFNPEFAFENMNLRLSTVEGNTMMSWVNEKGTAYIILVSYWKKEGQENVVGEYTDTVAATLPYDTESAYTTVAQAEADGWSWIEGVSTLLGTPLGTAILNHQVVLFTTEKDAENLNANDHIYLLKWHDASANQMVCKELYKGDLKFDTEHPIETLVSYENELIQKVYWTDGKNQPRVINIVGDIKPSLDTQFDFIPELQLQEKVSIKKQIGGGSFPAGVIQYCFTYFNKYMQESNIFYTSPLFYVSHANRAGSPEDTSIANSFKIRVEGVDDNFDYVRIYSVQRTSLNGTPIAKRVADVSLKEDKSSANTSTGDTGNSLDVNVDDDPTEVLTDSEGNKYIEYTDTGVNGDSIDPTELLYKGGYGIIAGTIEQKDSTLFMGNLIKQDTSIANIKGNLNISIDNHYYTTEVNNNEESVVSHPVLRSVDTGFSNEELETEVTKYVNELNCGTKYTDVVNNGELTSVEHEGVMCSFFNDYNYYRLGVQFQHKSGVWSEPLWLGDKKIDVKGEDPKRFSTPYTKQTFYGKIDGNSVKTLHDNGFLKARAVFVCPEQHDKVLLHQGVINPTMCEYAESSRESLYAFSSWFFRPVSYVSEIYQSYSSSMYYYNKLKLQGTEDEIRKIRVQKELLENGDEGALPPLYSPRPYTLKFSQDGELAAINHVQPFLLEKEILPNFLEIQGCGTALNTDWQTVTFNSPDLEFGDGSPISYIDSYYSPVGLASFDYTYAVMDIQTSTPAIKYSGAAYNNRVFKGVESCGIGAGFYYKDGTVKDDFNSQSDDSNQAWLTYPWQRDGSLNNDINRPNDSGVQSAVLKKKVISNTRMSYSSYTGIGHIGEHMNFYRPPVLFNSDQNVIEKLKAEEEEASVIYRGNMDTMFNSKNDQGNYYNFLDKNMTSTIVEYEKAKALKPDAFWLENTTEKIYRDLGKKGVILENEMTIPDNRKSTLLSYCNDIANHVNSINNITNTENREEVKNLFEDWNYIDNCARVLGNASVSDGKLNISESIDTYKLKRIIDEGVKHIKSYTQDLYCVDDKSGSALWFGAFKKNTLPRGDGWDRIDDQLGTTYRNLTARHSMVRMKYKSSPHLVFSVEGFNSESTTDQIDFWSFTNSPQKTFCLPIVNIENNVDTSLIYGGQSEDALKANVWVPCGEPVSLKLEVETVNGEEVVKPIYFYYLYGDTYYQRYDCLKTYPFTPEDVNQIVEIGSFMLESYVNIDGRYDRNRGQANNLNMTPQNFNLLNPVYSQRDNFFTYRIQEDDYYKNKEYPNQITWSKTKASGDETDMWTNVTMANTLEMDGDKGEVTKLVRLNDQLLCFQDTGISQILYNDNVQIASTTGVPIEIANSQKVQGKRYLSNTIGCSNKWSMVSTPAGIYFMDNVNKSIMMFNGQLNNLSQTGGFNTWCKNNILNTKGMWTPTDFNGDFVSYYDTINQDILFVGGDRALAFSEKFGTFTSFYDYGNTPYFCNLDGKGIWFKSINDTTTDLWQHQAGEYCEFFSTPDNPNYCSYWMTLVGNPEPQTDKIFTNLEFRATIDTDGKLVNDKFTPLLPFDALEVWDEYQHGYTSLENLTKHLAYTHGNESSSLKRKFRMWRCDIPRNNCVLDKDRDGHYDYSTDAELNVSRHIRKPMDRMRNPWLYLKLTKNPDEDNNYRTELHDFVMAYFN